jgi:hypothetical protein
MHDLHAYTRMERIGGRGRIQGGLRAARACIVYRPPVAAAGLFKCVI